MSQHSHSRPTTESWENEGGSLRSISSAESLGVTRLLTGPFTVGGHTDPGPADAVAQARRANKQRAGL